MKDIEEICAKEGENIMKKRLLFLLLLSALILSVLAGCDHTHSYGPWETKEEATCEEDGKEVRVCDCGEEQTRIIPQLEHEYESSVTKKATCTEEGKTTFQCKNCEDSYTEDIPKTEHTYEVTAIQGDTCEMDRLFTYTCKVCSHVKTENVPKSSHEYESTITKTATCQEKGEATYRCKNCKESYTEELPLVAHTYEITNSQPASCTEDGLDTYTCKVCSNVKTEILPPTGHDYEEAITKEPNCQENGEATYTCKTCRDSYTETLFLPTYDESQLYDLYKNSTGQVISYTKKGEVLAVGTCFVYAAEGWLITNYHIIEYAYSAKVTLGDITYDVQQILAYDKKTDVAMLKIDALELVPMVLCTTIHPVKDTVYFMDLIQGMNATIPGGKITAAEQELDGVKYIRHDAAASDGNSGAPLLNRFGEVIGIVTRREQDVQDYSFAISISQLERLDYSRPLSMEEYYAIEYNAYVRLRNLTVQAGELDGETGGYTWIFDRSYSSDNSEIYQSFLMYLPQSDQLTIGVTVINSVTNGFVRQFTITLDFALSGEYQWKYTDNTYMMMGIIYAESYEMGETLYCTDDNTPSAFYYKAYLGMASSWATYLVGKINIPEAEVTAAALGFAKCG